MFLAAHLPCLPPTLEDIDSINFALALEEFDVARHQPHPPGYPVFVAAGRVSTAVLHAAGVRAPEPWGLAVWSTISGAALICLLVSFFWSLPRRPGVAPVPPHGTSVRDPRDGTRALWATVIAVTSPLFWFTALRPLSDMTGLAGAVGAQVLLVRVFSGRSGGSALMWGGFLSGIAIGIRSQTFLLTLPLLGLALLTPGLGLRMRDRAAALAAAGLGVCMWAFPLVWASGGLSDYAAALGSQAGEDFSGVAMLWNARTPRVAVDALVAAFLWPWGSLAAGVAVMAAGAAGTVRVAWQQPRVLLLLAAGFIPYACFHLLFHEVATVRYALPLVVPVAYVVVTALEWPGRRFMAVSCTALVCLSLLRAVPAGVRYGRDGSPAFQALRFVERASDTSSSPAPAASSRVDAVGMHAVARRAAQWERRALPGRLLDAAHGREWLALVSEWRAHPDSAVAFVADPRRTDLALIDPASRRLVASYRWPFVEPPFVGGARPGNSDVYRMSPPRWMLDRGWALSAEVAGVTARDGMGPHRSPSVAWVRTRTGLEKVVLMLGGRHLGASIDPAARVVIRVDGRSLGSFDVPAGFFFRTLDIPPGALASSDAYIPLDVRAERLGTGPEVPVALEQFDLQGEGVPMIGVEEGWQEPEYDPRTARAWRWTTERSTLWVRPIGRDVTLVLQGESPLRYFDSAPAVTVSIGGREVGRFSPATDFRETIVLPAAELLAAEGRVVIGSDKWFVPGERDGSPDRRHLALRIYSYSVE